MCRVLHLFGERVEQFAHFRIMARGIVRLCSPQLGIESQGNDAGAMLFLGFFIQGVELFQERVRQLIHFFKLLEPIIIVRQHHFR